MANTTWTSAPWLSGQTWLLKDNTVVVTPEVEESGSGRRVRLKGEKKSAPKGDMHTLLRDAIVDIAKQRGTEPWVQLFTPEEVVSSHAYAVQSVGRVTVRYDTPPSLHFLDEERATKRGCNTSVAFEFESIEVPGVTATVWVQVANGDSYYSSTEVRSGITYRFMHEGNPANAVSFWDDGDNVWSTPFSRYDSSDAAETANEWLRQFDPTPGVEYVNHSANNARQAVIQALGIIKAVSDLDEINIPVWRDRSVPSAMKFKFKRTNFTNALYQQMLEFVQTKPTMERIKANWEAIRADLASLGIVTSDHDSGRNRDEDQFRKLVEQASGSELVCHMIPKVIGEEEADTGSTEIKDDPNHQVSIDLASGTIVVSCFGHDEETLNQWNFTRFQAELKGELDAFLGFAQQAQQKRYHRRFKKIVEQTAPDELMVPAITIPSAK